MPTRFHQSAETDETDISRLYAEITGAESTTTADGPVQAVDGFLDSALYDFVGDTRFEFDEELVKDNLEEILLTLVAHRSAETNGKRLMEDLSRVFDADLSPGTVYPQLHDFTESGLLEQHELVRTKEYQVADEATVTARLESKMRQHLVLGLFYHRALEEL